MQLYPAADADRDLIWHILEPTIREGDTYTLPRDMTRAAALAYWMCSDRETFVAEHNGSIVGTYYFRPNQMGGGSHVANCGYVTAREARGHGVAAAMCEHSITHARQNGFRAMQFNFVVSTNVRALQLWQRLGFEVVGRLPEAFQHPTFGYVDALVLFRKLT